MAVLGGADALSLWLGLLIGFISAVFFVVMDHQIDKRWRKP